MTNRNQKTNKRRPVTANRTGQRSATGPVLRFSPTAWAKLLFFCHRGETEIGGFGITPADDLLLVEEFVTVKQTATCVSVEFDDCAVADFFDSQIDAGRKPEQFARLWLHTHPGNNPTPSMTDEDTLARVFGRCEWAVMFILAEQGRDYARLQFNTGPRGTLLLPVQVEFSRPFSASDEEAWEAEYKKNVHPEPVAFGGPYRLVERGVVFDDPLIDIDESRRRDADQDIGDVEELVDLWDRENEVRP